MAAAAAAAVLAQSPRLFAERLLYLSEKTDACQIENKHSLNKGPDTKVQAILFATLIFLNFHSSCDSC